MPQTKQRLLILGAGVYQMPAIATAKALGLQVIAVDANPVAPGFTLADVSRVVDVRDIAGCLKVARGFQVDGVVSICTESAVATVAALAEELGLPGVSRAAAQAATDKFVMRSRWAATGLPGPAFAQASTLAEAVPAAREIGYPVVVKPVDNAGSRGVSRIDVESALPAAFDRALSQSLSRRVILEEFMDGVEATVESFTWQGKTQVLAMSEKVRIPFPACVSISLSYPPSFAAEVQQAIQQVVCRAIKALGIDQGPTHTEVLVTSRGIKLVELAARGGGFGIVHQIVPIVSGVDLVRATIQVALGLQPDITPQYARAAVLRFFQPQAFGTVRRIRGVEDAKRMEGIVEVVMEVKPGQLLGPITRDGERPGYLIASAPTRELALQYADAAERAVRFEVVAAEQATAGAAGRP
ncbi:MAG: ATP-grasp domain-containing protein [Candidatus Omnitrophica bacterium]|nr:ATP-grasp domain-containing protein [Candidatus Omnitrophota bacterium]